MKRVGSILTLIALSCMAQAQGGSDASTGSTNKTGIISGAKGFLSGLCPPQPKSQAELIEMQRKQLEEIARKDEERARQQKAESEKRAAEFARQRAEREQAEAARLNAEKAEAKEARRLERYTFAQENFVTPFLIAVGKGEDPLAAYLRILGGLTAPDRKLSNMDSIEEQMVEQQTEEDLYSYEKATAILEIKDSQKQREAVKVACVDIASILCDPETGKTVGDKITEFYVESDKINDGVEKEVLYPLLTRLEKGENPFIAYKKTLVALAEKYGGDTNELSNLNELTADGQRQEMASACRDFSPRTGDSTLKVISKIRSYYRAEEEALFAKRTKGRHLIGRGIDGFTLSSLGLKPDFDTVYAYTSPVYPLKILQSAKDGVLVCGQNLFNSGEIPDRNLFVKTSRQYADNDTLQSGFFVYTGIIEYQTILGNNARVHTFEEIENPTRDLFFYP